MKALRKLIAVVILALAGAACGPARDPATTPAAPSPDVERVEMLPTPFTAEQIRAEWAEGLRLTMRRWALTGERLERWRVVAADAEGVEIEHATVDADGTVVGDAVTRRSTWTELRDHASFSMAVATRSRVTRSTAFGELEGWLYSVAGPEGGMTTEMFFADSLPGAPVQMTVWQEGEKVLELEQLERVRPPAPASE